MLKIRLKLAHLLVVATALVGACEHITPGETVFEHDEDIGANDPDRKTIFGEGGVSLFGDNQQDSGSAIGVNAFLWRASLDTISFMPVNTADAFGGVIITDWHSSAEAPNERFKLNVYILGRALRADGVRVSVFRQVLTRNGQWLDSEVPVETRTKIEDAILTRARQMRNAALVQQEK